MLVRVDEVVVGCVVQEDEAEADPEAAKARTEPVQVGVACPGEDDETQWDEPAGAHHGNQAILGRWVAVEAGCDFEVVFVDPRGANGGGNDTEGEGNLRMTVSTTEFSGYTAISSFILTENDYSQTSDRCYQHSSLCPLGR